VTELDRETTGDEEGPKDAIGGDLGEPQVMNGLVGLRFPISFSILSVMG